MIGYLRYIVGLSLVYFVYWLLKVVARVLVSMVSKRLNARRVNDHNQASDYDHNDLSSSSSSNPKIIEICPQCGYPLKDSCKKKCS